VTRDFDAAPSANVTRLSAKRRGFELPRAREFSMRRRSGPRLRSAYGRKGWRAHRCWNDGAVREREADETPPPRKNFRRNCKIHELTSRAFAGIEPSSFHAFSRRAEPPGGHRAGRERGPLARGGSRSTPRRAKRGGLARVVRGVRGGGSGRRVPLTRRREGPNLPREAPSSFG
jgi:hypothetical protein